MMGSALVLFVLILLILLVLVLVMVVVVKYKKKQHSRVIVTDIPLPITTMHRLTAEVADSISVDQHFSPSDQDRISQRTMKFSDSDDTRGRGSSSEREPEEIIVKNLRALVVYPLQTPLKDTILSKLVAPLNEFKGIEPISYDLVSVRHVPFTWAQQEIASADAVLCVWTKQFKRDWERRSTIINALETAIMAKICRDEKCEKFATILLDESDRQFIPDLLAVNRVFTINDIHMIAAFVKDIPMSVLP